MAATTIRNKEVFDKQVSEHGYVSAADPCCGSGAMAIGLVKVLSEYGVEGLGGKLFAILTDIDYTCVKMAFIQMSLLGLSARVVWGDTLTNRVDAQFDTPTLQTALMTGCFRIPKTLSAPYQLTLF
jgi:type I restriction-modification system DNA methylase subunit